MVKQTWKLGDFLTVNIEMSNGEPFQEGAFVEADELTEEQVPPPDSLAGLQERCAILDDLLPFLREVDDRLGRVEAWISGANGHGDASPQAMFWAEGQVAKMQDQVTALRDVSRLTSEDNAKLARERNALLERNAQLEAVVDAATHYMLCHTDQARIAVIKAMAALEK